MKELKEKLEESNSKIAERDNLVAEREQELAARNNPQEEAWRKRIIDNAVQIL